MVPSSMLVRKQLLWDATSQEVNVSWYHTRQSLKKKKNFKKIPAKYYSDFGV